MSMNLDQLVEEYSGSIAELEEILGYQFSDRRLLQLALIHSSYAFEQTNIRQNNETLEFLGDAVLDLTVGYILYKRYPGMREGELTKLRAALVNENHLAMMAKAIDLGKFLCLGKGEDASNGRHKSSILSCAYEAVVGAVFEDSDYETVTGIVNRFFLPAISGKKEELLLGDAKSRLQEFLQEKHSEAPLYHLDQEDGPSHQKTFFVSVRFRDEILGTGQAGSKKEAEQRAATAALDKIRKADIDPMEMGKERE